MTHDDAHFIYCSACGFYPSDTTERVGIRTEAHAANLSELHRRTNPGHETFLVPGSWLSDTAETHVQRGFR